MPDFLAKTSLASFFFLASGARKIATSIISRNADGEDSERLEFFVFSLI